MRKIRITSLTVDGDSFTIGDRIEEGVIEAFVIVHSGNLELCSNKCKDYFTDVSGPFIAASVSDTKLIADVPVEELNRGEIRSGDYVWRILGDKGRVFGVALDAYGMTHGAFTMFMSIENFTNGSEEYTAGSVYDRHTYEYEKPTAQEVIEKTT